MKPTVYPAMYRAIRHIVLLVAILSLFGCGQSKAKKAREFISAGMFPQAIVLLEEQIQASPTDAEAHFLLGQCRLATGDLPLAEDSFLHAVRLDASYGKKIGTEIFELANQTMTDASALSQGPQLFTLAIKYDPALKPKVAELYLQAAQSSQEPVRSQAFFRVAADFGADRANISKHFLSATKAALQRQDYNAAFPHFRQASFYDSGANAQCADALAASLETAKEDMPPELITRLMDEVLSFSLTSTGRVAKFLVHRANTLLNKGNTDGALPLIRILVNHAQIKSVLDPNDTKQLLIRTANELVETNTERFAEVMKLLLSIDPAIGAASEPINRYLYGAYLWLFDSKQRGLELLRSLEGAANVPNIAFVSQPLPRGKVPLNINKTGDFGWGKFTLTVVSIEVPDANTVLVNIAVRNHTEKQQHFLFAHTPEEKFVIIDDQGKKLYAAQPYFSRTADVRKFNSSNDEVFLNPSQEITDTLRFPMTSLGTCAVTFISPQHNGHQWEITFNDIPLRKVRFSKFPR